MQKIIELKHITKSFDGGEPVLKDVSLDVYDNEFLTLLGPSGCGKTTILRIIGGFEQPDEGDVLFLGERINDIPAHKRNVNTVFQRYALFSGGQQQRVAIARALISHPRVLLLDEPLGALDLKLRKDMQQELKNIQKQTGITFVFVTHDQEEALSMSDTIVVMSEGKIHQIGSPTDIYNEPSNAFVADFIGESNILDGVMVRDRVVSFSGNTPVDVVVRPEDVDIVPVEKGMLRGVVTSVTFMGVHYEIIVDIGGFKWMIQTTDFVGEGETIGLYIEPDAIHVMPRSEYSGMFGDYSSFSNELDELSIVESEEDE